MLIFDFHLSGSPARLIVISLLSNYPFYPLSHLLGSTTVSSCGKQTTLAGAFLTVDFDLGLDVDGGLVFIVLFAVSSLLSSLCKVIILHIIIKLQKAK